MSKRTSEGEKICQGTDRKRAKKLRRYLPIPRLEEDLDLWPAFRTSETVGNITQKTGGKRGREGRERKKLKQGKTKRLGKDSAKKGGKTGGEHGKSANIRRGSCARRYWDL